MEPAASIKFLERDLKKLVSRASRYNWQLKQEGFFVKAQLPQSQTSKTFRLLLFCYGYPRRLISAEFMPEPSQTDIILWPNDNEQMFRIHSSGNKIPFICMAGLKTYIPENDEMTIPYSMDDIHVANIVTRIAQKIESPHCSYLEVKVK